eukprot:CAMPEP_0113960262 /NCGR_PEP_ID=MMETSP0011_2-20120614/4613_1 /TAXON_ID=101924 /ORGANISM="Rhodosorus marinus" /LENGTH=1052 /DNA_ID=CAMNT_0000971687 /DNA_START=142 /DNA_END=3297 /DNA_ORIENTATION=+ /assembly_acc=CAM_ASM_000156
MPDLRVRYGHPRSPSTASASSVEREHLEEELRWEDEMQESTRMPRTGVKWSTRLKALFKRKKNLKARTIHVGTEDVLDDNGRPLEGRRRWMRRRGQWKTYRRRGSNAICNQKYSLLSFLPKVLIQQFSMFYNMFYLMIAISQFIPLLRVGFVWTYMGPLSFVVLASMAKEASDELLRIKRDRQVNNYEYTLLVKSEDAVYERTEEHISSISDGFVKKVKVRSRDICVGDVLQLDCDERVPADCVLLRVCGQSEDVSESVFIRTDQLDGETDWKVRRAVNSTRKLDYDVDVVYCGGSVYAEKPHKEIYDFTGNFYAANSDVEPLTLENTLWMNTVVASGTVICMVVYTGRETRAVLNTSQPGSKVGTLDLEVNFMSKLLFLLLIGFSFTLACLRGFYPNFGIYFLRYFLLLAYMIPLAMRVNLDLARVVYSYFMMHDEAKMPGCLVRSSNLPEELGRVDYLLSDKTGTLTQNDMEMKKLHIGLALFGRENEGELASIAQAAFGGDGGAPSRRIDPSSMDVTPYLSEEAAGRRANPQRRIQNAVRDVLLAIAIAHNVTPAEDHGQRTMQASSPDEIALVKFVESVGIVLLERTQNIIRLRTPTGNEVVYEILYEFPFTSEAKRMGIIVRESRSRQIQFYVKGADSIMANIVKYNDWLDEECGNLARDGLRTLVYGKRTLDEETFRTFEDMWTEARTQRHNRKEAMAAAQSSIERALELVGLTGVEDKLQDNVRESLEKLRHAGIRIWMLTGDKVETAVCIAVSSRLAERSQQFFTITGLASVADASKRLNTLRRRNGEDVVVVDGSSLQIMLDNYPHEFMELMCRASSAVACRCSPTQKAAIARLVQNQMNKRVAAIGDGGNDVSMIQMANVGIGIPGKEGQQASLAADFSIVTFSHLNRLLLWHGRNSYKRAARLSQFIVHRGLIIATIQIVHCAMYYYAAVAVYNSWIQVGYATLFTMLPVFSLVLDEDISEWVADTYPELYRELRKGRSLNTKSFLTWVFKSVYQGTVIMVISVFVLWDDHYFTTMHLSAISFSALVFTELIMIAAEIHKW